jgi:hypothetical protein
LFLYAGGERCSIGQPMSKGLLPWSLKGVSLEARARAKAAAAEAGEPLGKWLGDTIREVARAEAAGSAPAAARPDPGAAAADADAAAAPIAANPPPPIAPDPPAGASREEEAAPVAADLVTGGIAAPASEAAQASADNDGAAQPSPPPAAEDWRTAVAALTERLEQSERRLADRLAPLQLAVERLASRIDGEPPRTRRGWRLPALPGFGRRRDDR